MHIVRVELRGQALDHVVPVEWSGVQDAVRVAYVLDVIGAIFVQGDHKELTGTVYCRCFDRYSAHNRPTCRIQQVWDPSRHQSVSSVYGEASGQTQINPTQPRKTKPKQVGYLSLKMMESSSGTWVFIVDQTVVDVNNLVDIGISSPTLCWYCEKRLQQ